MKLINCIFSGSSTKFPIFAGIVKGLKDNGYNINQAIGTSGGGLILACIKAGWHPDELINKILEIDFKSYVRFSFWKYIVCYFRGFLIKNYKLIELFDQVYQKKLLSDVDNLKLIAVDLEKDETVILDKENYSDMPLSYAVMATICIPGIFQPVIWKTQFLVDGGVRDYIGIDYVTDFSCPTLVCVIRNVSKKTGLYKNLFEILFDSFTNLFDANVDKSIEIARNKNFIILELEYDLPFWQFDVDISQKRDMIRYGYDKCRELFSKRILL